MADERPVHVLSREEGWVVVREGNDRATSVHRTQAEAAEAGREIARKHGTPFLLHAKDGRVRDRTDYGEGSGSPEERLENPVAAGDTAGGVASSATRAAGGVVGLASGAAGEAIEEIGAAATGDQGGDRSVTTHEEEGTDSAEEAGGLVYEERYAGYEVYDRKGERLGNVGTLFLDEDDRPEYMGVKMGLLGTRSTLIPWAAVTREDEEGRRLEVGVEKEMAENGPAFEEYQEITPELERKVHRHYELERTTDAEDRGAYDDYYPNTAGVGPTAGTPDPDAAGPGLRTGGTGTGPFSEHGSEGSNLREAGPEEEVRVRRSEEELVAGTTKREAGALRVRKRVRIERETIEVPVRREEVYVERVPLSGEAGATEAAATEAEIGEEEIVVPVLEEEVVVEKRPVIKEEIRIRKEVVEDTEVVEEDVRREEIDIDDETSSRRTDV